MGRTLRNLIVVVTLFAANLFFSLQGLFHAAYNPSLYKGFVIGSGIVTLIICVWELVLKKVHTGITFWMMGIFLPIAFVADYYLEFSTMGIRKGIINFILPVTIASCLPAIYVGLYFANKGLQNVSKWLDIIHIILTLGVFNAVVGAKGGYVWMGMASYQIISYQAAFCFCMAICYIFMGDKINRFALFKVSWFRYVEYVMLAMSLISCIGSGGRGGFFLIVGGSLYILYVTGKLTRMIGSGIVVLGILLMLSNAVLDEHVTNRFNYGANRVFSYVSDDGSIDMSKTSGRGVIFEGAWEYSKRRHFMGSGLLRADSDFNGYPHNLELEWLIQGGVFYLLFWVVVLLYVNRNIMRLSLTCNEYLLLPIFAYPMINLQGSGTYLQDPLFWFCVTYAFARVGYLRSQGEII